MEELKEVFYIAIIDDFQFCVHLYKRWKGVDLSEEQNKELKKILPTFATVSLFCTSIDLLTRVVNKQTPPKGKNGMYFQ